METVSRRGEEWGTGRERALGKGTELWSHPRHGGPDGNKGQVVETVQAPNCAETHLTYWETVELSRVRMTSVCVGLQVLPPCRPNCPVSMSQEHALVRPGSLASMDRLHFSLTR